MKLNIHNLQPTQHKDSGSYIPAHDSYTSNDVVSIASQKREKLQIFYKGSTQAVMEQCKYTKKV